jgi:NAD(P)-dependent dehydrogenase (short-subunit alcohol dehydrogenase family)
VNNAGIQHTAPLAEMPREKWDTILAVNLSAAFQTMQAAMPGMAQRGYGRVINIASVHGLVASKDKAPYVAAKFGLVGLSRVAALEYAASGDKAKGGVTVNCICPGWTETAIIEPQIEAAQRPMAATATSASRNSWPRNSPVAACPTRPRSGRSRSGSVPPSRTTSPALRSRSTAAGRRNKMLR